MEPRRSWIVGSRTATSVFLRYTERQLAPLRNLVAALCRLENSREPEDVQRVENRGALRSALAGMAQRGVPIAYVQQAVEGRVVKFYGVSGGEYFAALDEEDEKETLSEQVRLDLARSAAAAAATLGLETWGGDAVIDGDRFMMIDFNDWPSFSRVREAAARAIARRCLMLARRPRQGF